MNCSIIQKSQLEGATRLDAEYYQPEYLNLIKRLEILKAVPIREIASNPKRKFKPVKGKKFEYVEISEINLENGEYNTVDIFGEDAPDRAQWTIKKDDIIVSTVRPIRSAISLINDQKENLVCSSGFAVLKTEKIEPEYLFAYLKSRPITRLLDRLTTATAYPAVAVNDILDTKIYLGSEVFRKEIKSMIVGVGKKLLESRILYAQADSLLLEELDLKNFDVDESLSSIVNLSEIKASRRMDPDFFQIKYKKLINSLDKFDTKKLIEIAKRRKGILKTESKNEYKYIEIGDINVGNGEINHNVIQGSELPANAKMKISGGELMISKVRPTRGAIAIIPENWKDDFIASGAFSVFDVQSPMREYLQVILRSIIGKLQLEKPTTGTSYPTVTDEDIENIKIPILPKETQQIIADLVRQSHEARKKSKELLEEAKRKVEEMIEGKK